MRTTTTNTLFIIALIACSIICSNANKKFLAENIATEKNGEISFEETSRKYQSKARPSVYSSNKREHTATAPLEHKILKNHMRPCHPGSKAMCSDRKPRQTVMTAPLEHKILKTHMRPCHPGSKAMCVVRD